MLENLEEKKKPVIICGDFNVAREEIDLARPRDNIGNPGLLTRSGRGWMGLLKPGLLILLGIFIRASSSILGGVIDSEPELKTLVGGLTIFAYLKV